MKMRLAMLFLASSVLAGPAMAADLAARPAEPMAPAYLPYSWTGFYVGVQGGYGFGSDTTQKQGPITSGKIDLNGGLIGATAGYNYQYNQFVIGAEADYAWSDFKGTTQTFCAAPGCHTEVRSFGTARLRAGYAFDRFLPYITAGAAFGDVKGTALGASGSDFRGGWTAGVGLEYAIYQNFSVKAEYLYYDLGRFNYFTVAPPISTNARGSVIRIGLNYKF